MGLIRERPKLFGTLGVLLAAIVAALVALPPHLLHTPFTYDSARAWWERQALRHYALEVEARAEEIDLHLLLEVRDEQFVGGINLRTGAQLTPDDLAPHVVWLPVDHLFDRIALHRYSSTTWRHQVAYLAPWMARQLNWCYVRPMRAGYDQRLGYPATVRFQHNVCSLHDALNVHLSVTPLPN